MRQQIEIKHVKSHTIAAIRKRTSYFELSKLIPSLFGEVYSFLKSSSFKKFGHNIVLYLDEKPTIEAGVMIENQFENTIKVICSSLPGGPVLRIVHIGQYNELPGTHTAARNWAQEIESYLKEEIGKFM